MTDLPVAPAVAAVEAVVNTISNPTPAVIAEDMVLVFNLAKTVREQLAGKHPDLLHIFWTLFNHQ
jgi:hypothetical protein